MSEPPVVPEDLDQPLQLDDGGDPTLADAIAACTMKGVTELPPVEGRSYAAFVVHPPRPRFTEDGSSGPVTVAIAHYDGDRATYVLDLVKDEITVAASCRELKRYGISKVQGHTSDDYDETGMAEAVCGAFHILRAAL